MRACSPLRWRHYTGIGRPVKSRIRGSALRHQCDQRVPVSDALLPLHARRSRPAFYLAASEDRVDAQAQIPEQFDQQIGCGIHLCFGRHGEIEISCERNGHTIRIYRSHPGLVDRCLKTLRPVCKSIAGNQEVAGDARTTAPDLLPGYLVRGHICGCSGVVDDNPADPSPRRHPGRSLLRAHARWSQTPSRRRSQFRGH